MNKYIIILISVFLTLCRKEENLGNCTGEYCLGKNSSILRQSDMASIPIDSLVVKFSNDNLDTLEFILRSAVNEPFVYQKSCNCEEKSTHFEGQYFICIYQLKSEDYALKYVVSTNMNGGVGLEVYLSDTNTVLHNIYKQTNPCSQFLIYNYLEKSNDFDSLFVNGNWYTDVINSFNYMGVCETGRTKEVFFSKGVGLIQFNYLGKVYRRIR